ncbi:DNA primase family protein [Negativibacillus massiliensis]|uniref:DNA primase family protein n=1 Tax=Negativibacillus massiliensis TaxID=1871035 RepID=UPI0023F75818|nr:phage/plasmid primase, P4 family [Negativibacillus massiliensis]
MKKNKNKKKKSPFILSDQNNHSKLFADINLDDFKDRRKNLGELEKLYMNLESEYDDIDPDEEYRKISKANKKKHHKKRRKHVFDDIIELNDWDDIDEKTDDFDDEIPVVPNQSIRLDSASSDSLPAPVSSTMSDPDINANPIKDRALQIAEDFADRTNIILVDGVLYRYNGVFYSLFPDNDIQKMLLEKYRTEMGKSNTASMLRNTTNLLRFCVKRECSEFPENQHIIVFENGTLEVKSGFFRQNSPADLVNSALGISYDPDCKKMPYTKRFLKTIADGDDDLYERLLQVIGYILSNDIRAKSFFYLEGVGDAGKSRFCDLIASFFPVSGSNKVARIALQDLGGKFALSNLVNAKLNISEDLPDAPLSPQTVSRIKMISDGDRLEAEAKYTQAFTFRPLCKLLFASNHPLRLKEYDAAFVNRVVYIPFTHPIPKEEQDPYILEKMRKELPALFNRAFAAYKRLVANQYVWAGSDYFKPEIATTNSSISVDKEYVLRQFIESCCILDDNSTTATSELQAAYNLFCSKNSYSPVQGDRFSRELFAVLPDNILRVKIGNQRRGFKGIRLKSVLL